jgi:hypothetical protein
MKNILRHLFFLFIILFVVLFVGFLIFKYNEQSADIKILNQRKEELLEKLLVAQPEEAKHIVIELDRLASEEKSKGGKSITDKEMETHQTYQIHRPSGTSSQMLHQRQKMLRLLHKRQRTLQLFGILFIFIIICFIGGCK